MKKTIFYNEIAYFIALALLAFGTALTAYGDFGISMVVAPAYVLHLFLSQYLPFFSFGMAEYVLQAVVLLVLTAVLHKGKPVYLLSFGATLLYGLALDASMILASLLPANFYLQTAAYGLGVVICCGSIALLFFGYLPPEAYELFSKEISAKYRKPVYKVVNLYNLGSLFAAIALSLVFFGELRGVGVGTVVCAVVYGFLIRLFQKLYGRLFCFADRFAWRKYFEESEVII